MQGLAVHEKITEVSSYFFSAHKGIIKNQYKCWAELLSFLHCLSGPCSWLWAYTTM